jgi:hypothetical protein
MSSLVGKRVRNGKRTEFRGSRKLSSCCFSAIANEIPARHGETKE